MPTFPEVSEVGIPEVGVPGGSCSRRSAFPEVHVSFLYRRE
jgi:hypothetical protein